VTPNPSLEPGAVLRPSRLGPIEAGEDSTLVVLFLGSCKKNQEPSVPAYLRQVGFVRTHYFEALVRTIDQTDNEISIERVNYSADTPRDAVDQAVRLTAWFKNQGLSVTGLQVRLAGIGPINGDGSPGIKYGRVFAAWSDRSGRAIEELLDDDAASTDVG